MARGRYGMRLPAICERYCCQYCCHDGRQRPSGADHSRISTQGTDSGGQPWTTCPSLRIRRLGFESLRARQVTGPESARAGSAANEFANTSHQPASTALAKMTAASTSCSLMTWAYTHNVTEGAACPSLAATTWTGTPALSGV